LRLQSGSAPARGDSERGELLAAGRFEKLESSKKGEEADMRGPSAVLLCAVAALSQPGGLGEAAFIDAALLDAWRDVNLAVFVETIVSLPLHLLAQL
jgi:hypothetical protein